MLRPLVAIAALGLLAMPANAMAKPGQYVLSESQKMEVNLGASNGYRLQIYADPREGVVVQAYGKQGVVSYLPQAAPVETGVIKAKLPGVGRVALRFRPDGSAHKEAPYCTGPPGRVETGTFVGAIRFRGERGYTAASAARARGTTTTSYRQVCKGDGESDSALPNDIRWINLSAGAKWPSQTSVWFSVSRLELGTDSDDETVLTGYVSSARDGMKVFRIVTVTGGANLLSIPDPTRLGSATVTAKAPFSGTATYRAEGNRTASWTGTLSAEFPGLGEVALAGSKFSSELCVNEECSGEASRSNGALIVAGGRG